MQAPYDTISYLFTRKKTTYKPSLPLFGSISNYHGSL